MRQVQLRRMIMTSKSYRVVFIGRSALKVKFKRLWKNPEYSMTIRDDLHENITGGPPKHTGLIYTVDIIAKNIVESIHKAISHGRHITDQISVVHGVVIEYPLPQFSIDIEQTNEDRELAQVIYNVPVFQLPRRPYEHDFYNSFYNLLDKLRRENAKSAMRIDRALHYLRSSYLEKDLVDQFEDAWVALEAINPIIRKKYSQPNTYQRKCPECKKDLFCQNCSSSIRDADNASGVDYIITQLLAKSPAVASKLRKKRIDIVHARAPLSVVLKNIANKTHLAQRAAIAGILDILDFPKDKWLCSMPEILPVKIAPVIIVRATLFNLPVETLKAQTKYPQLHLKSCEKLLPNLSEVHSGELRPLAAKLHIGIYNFNGKWNIIEVNSLLEVGIEEDESITQIIAVKDIQSVGENNEKGMMSGISRFKKWIGNLFVLKTNKSKCHKKH
jgi:hypothetical protein